MTTAHRHDLIRAYLEREDLEHVWKHYLAGAPDDASNYLAGRYSILADICEKIADRGDLSTGQLTFLAELADTIDGELNAQDCPAGPSDIVGVIIKAEDRYDKYSRRNVVAITVKDNRGFLVWGSAPENIQAQAQPGHTVRFSAMVTPKTDKFGFFKRPKACTIAK